MLAFNFLGLSSVIAQNSGCEDFFTYTVIDEDECLFIFEVTPPDPNPDAIFTITISDGDEEDVHVTDNFIVTLPGLPVTVTFYQVNPNNPNQPFECTQSIEANQCTQACTESLQLSICERVDDRCYKSTGEVFFEDSNGTGTEFDIYSMEMRLRITEGNATFDMVETELIANLNGFDPTSDYTFFVAPKEIIFTIFCDSDDDAYQLPYGACETAPLIRFVANKIPNEDYMVEATIIANITGEGTCNSVIDPPENCFVAAFEPETLANSTDGIANCTNNDLVVTVEDSYLEPLTGDNPGKLEITLSNTTDDAITVTQLDIIFDYTDVNGNIGEPEFTTPASAIPTGNGYYVTYPLLTIPANSDMTILELCVPPPSGPQNTYGKAILDFDFVRVANGTDCCTLPFSPQTFEYEFAGENPCEFDSFDGKVVQLNIAPLPSGAQIMGCQTGYSVLWSITDTDSSDGIENFLNVEELTLRITSEIAGDLFISSVVPGDENDLCPANNQYAITQNYDVANTVGNCIGFNDTEVGWIFQTGGSHQIQDGDGFQLIFDGDFGTITNIEVTEFSLKTTENKTACIPDFIGIAGGNALLPIESPCNFCSDVSLTAENISINNASGLEGCEQGFSLVLSTLQQREFTRIFLKFQINITEFPNDLVIKDAFSIECNGNSNTDCISHTDQIVTYEYIASVNDPLEEIGNIDLLDVLLTGQGEMNGIIIEEFVVEYLDENGGIESCEPQNSTAGDADLIVSNPQIDVNLVVTPSSSIIPAPHYIENDEAIYELKVQNFGSEDLTIPLLEFGFSFEDMHGTLSYPGVVDIIQPLVFSMTSTGLNQTQYDFSLENTTILAGEEATILYFTVSPPMDNPYYLGEAQIIFDPVEVTAIDADCDLDISNSTQNLTFEGHLPCEVDNSGRTIINGKTVVVEIAPTVDPSVIVRSCELVYDVTFSILEGGMPSSLDLSHFLLDMDVLFTNLDAAGSMQISQVQLIDGLSCGPSNSCGNPFGDGCISFTNNPEFGNVSMEVCPNPNSSGTTLSDGGRLRIRFEGLLSSITSVEVNQLQLGIPGTSEDCIPPNISISGFPANAPCDFCNDLSIIAMPLTSETEIEDCENGFSLQLLNVITKDVVRILVDFDIIQNGNADFIVNRITPLFCPQNNEDCAEINGSTNVRYEFEVPLSNSMEVNTGSTALLDVVVSGEGSMNGITFNEVTFQYLDATGSNQFCEPAIADVASEFSLDITLDGGCKTIVGHIETTPYVSASGTVVEAKDIGDVYFDVIEAGGAADCNSLVSSSCEENFESLGGLGCDGNYSYSIECEENEFILIPSKEGCYKNGVSTFDLVLISKHILNTQFLDTEYKKISADVNNSKTITTLDLVKIRKVILNQTDRFDDNYTNSWRFTPESTVFEPNPTNPNNPPLIFPECAIINTNLSNILPQDFIGMKLGDVNNSVSACLECEDAGFAQSLIESDDRSSQILSLEIPDLTHFSKGDVFEFNISMSEFEDLNAYQFGLFINPEYLEILEMKPTGKAEDLLDFNFGISEVTPGNIRMLWFSPNGEPVSWSKNKSILKIKGKLNKKVRAQKEVFQLKNELLQNIAFDNRGYEFPLQLNFLDNYSVDKSKIEVTIIPNPFDDKVTFSIWSPVKSKGNLKIWDFQGRELQSETVSLNQGWNNITINSTNNWQKGILSYMIEIEESRSFGKIIKK